jgi:polysaccharide biosynthesis protein PelA
LPYIAEANGFVRQFKRDGNVMRFQFGGYYEPFVKLANAGSCRVSVDGHAVAAQREGNSLRFPVPLQGEMGPKVVYRAVEVSCGN